MCKRYGELWDGTRSPQACLADAVTQISSRNSIVGQFLHRCLSEDPEARPYPYDLYTFFSNQCKAASSIVLAGARARVCVRVCVRARVLVSVCLHVCVRACLWVETP